MPEFVQQEKEQHADLELNVFNRPDHGVAGLEPGNQAENFG